MSSSFSNTDFNGSRDYWRPQVEDPLLSSFTKIAIDAPGFAHSRTRPAGSAWSFDLAAAAVLAILDQEIGEGEQVACIIGDSMGGAHTGLRAALRDEERRKDGKKRRIAGVVACGTAAEEESAGEYGSGGLCSRNCRWADSPTIRQIS